MKSVRLTNDRREVILSNLLKDKFIVPIEEFDKEKNKLSERFYLEFFGKAVLKKMYALPDDWLRKVEGFSVKLGAHSHYVHAEESWKHSNKLVSRYYDDRYEVRMPNKVDIMFPADHELSVAYQKIESAKDKIAEQRAHAYAQADSVLRSVTTLKRLMEIWPEIGPYIPANMWEEQTLPALPIQSLNETFGLNDAGACRDDS